MEEEIKFATPPSGWVRRFAPLIPGDGPVLDLACGSGRHTRLLLDLGYRVTAADRDLGRLEAGAAADRLKRIEADLETGGVWPFGNRRFAGIIVANYLHRPLMPFLGKALAPDGLLIYETFTRGNEVFGKPSNPDFLLKPGELLETFGGAFRILAYEEGVIENRAAVQRIALVNGGRWPRALPPG